MIKAKSPVSQIARRGFIFDFNKSRKTLFPLQIFILILFLLSSIHYSFADQSLKIKIENQPIISGSRNQDKQSNGKPALPQEAETKSGNIKDFFDIVKSIATVAAIIIGGIWTYKLFYMKRQKQPHANLMHNITHLSISETKLLLRITVIISNEGDILLPIKSGFTRLLKILPLSDDFSEYIRTGDVPMVEDSSEIDWPLIDELETELEMELFEIEPGESDEVSFDFILNAGENDVILIYTHLQNVIRSETGLGWHLSAIYDLRQ